MRHLLLLLLLSMALPVIAAEVTAPPAFDAALAQRLGADERGMHRFMFVVLTSGAKSDFSDAERDELFRGHMRNIGRMADAGQLVVAGPLGKNDRNYRGIFVFDVASEDEARALLVTDPAVKAGLFAFEIYEWYASAALKEVSAIHKRIDNTRH